MDFKKAFDSVCHKTLKQKLLAYGIKGKLLREMIYLMTTSEKGSNMW